MYVCEQTYSKEGVEKSEYSLCESIFSISQAPEPSLQPSTCLLVMEFNNTVSSSWAIISLIKLIIAIIVCVSGLMDMP